MEIKTSNWMQMRRLFRRAMDSEPTVEFPVWVVSRVIDGRPCFLAQFFDRVSARAIQFQGQKMVDEQEAPPAMRRFIRAMMDEGHDENEPRESEFLKRFYPQGGL